MITAEDLDYELPIGAVGRALAEPREAGRLLVAPAGGPFVDATVGELWRFVGPGDLIILNATQSRASRLNVRVGEVETELLAIEPVDEWVWVVRMPADAPVKAGTMLEVAGADARITLLKPDETACWLARFASPSSSVEDLLEAAGSVPLPPYASDLAPDRSRVRTTFGHDLGSAAPPTAGLHLSTETLERCLDAGAEIAEVTLHVSLRTSRYRMVDPARPKLHSERFEVSEQTLEACRSAQRTIAIGTTVVRALETCASTGEAAGSTSIFLTRGHRFAYVDVLFTNFQAPRSTMLAMLDAFAGPRWRGLYETGIERGYRFLALGDACLVTGQRPRTMRI